MVVKIERKRYLLIEFFGNVPRIKDLIIQLRTNISKLRGEIGLARSSVHVVDIIGKFAIIRATQQSRDVVESAVQLLNIENSIAVVRTVSGSINKIYTQIKEGSEKK